MKKVKKNNSKNNLETAVLGGGCFWCTEAIFKMLKGITSVEPGYSGGNTENPIYEEVASGKTGHIEVVKILLENGANPNIANDGGLTPLMSAVWKEEIEPVKVLVRHPGIDLTITDHEGSTALEMGEYKEYEYRYVCEFDEEEVMSAIVAELKGVGGSRRGTMKRKTMKRKTMKRMNLKADRVKKLK